MQSDRSVPWASQSGGINSNGQYDNIPAVDHITVTDNVNTAGKIRPLLDALPDDANKFIQVLSVMP